MVSIIFLYYNLMGPRSYVWTIVDRNIVMRRMTVCEFWIFVFCTRVGTLIVATIYLQLIQNRYMF